MFEVVTYATHSQGMFDELVKDNKVKVLGWGKKWNGFVDKYKGLYDYIKHKPDDMIIIFVDGFDTKINRDPKGAIELFKKRGYKLLFSRDAVDDKLNIVFGTCKDGITINTGLYMGYVKYLKHFLESMLKQKCKDDQVIANNNCKNFDFIDIDKENEIFFNSASITKYFVPINHNAYFIGYPGGGNFELKDIYKKGKYALKGYPQFFIIPIITITLSLSVIFPNYNFLFILIGFIFLLSTVYFTDISCMCL
tara:strand:+ start:470 stop:1222 length:753 start_codon:yes stop_codon:yes gene_type:complete